MRFTLDPDLARLEIANLDHRRAVLEARADGVEIRLGRRFADRLRLEVAHHVVRAGPGEDREPRHEHRDDDDRDLDPGAHGSAPGAVGADPVVGLLAAHQTPAHWIDRCHPVERLGQRLRRAASASRLQIASLRRRRARRARATQTASCRFATAGRAIGD